MQDVLQEYKLENAKGYPHPVFEDLLDKFLDEAFLRTPLALKATALSSDIGEVVLVECYLE